MQHLYSVDVFLSKYLRGIYNDTPNKQIYNEVQLVRKLGKSVQTFVHNSILLIGLEFNYTVRDFLVRGTGSLQTSMLFEIVYKSFCWFISLISVIQTGIDQRSSTLTSRRYPWAIQRLVSTHWGRMGILGYSKLKVPSADQIFIGGRGGRVILGYSKLKVPSRGQIFIFGIGGSTLDQVIPEIPTSLRIFISGEGVYPWRRGVFWTPHS